jgi:exosortase/archaeosortase
MNLKDILYTFLRYILLVIIGLPGAYFFYFIFTPLTVYPVFWILRLFCDVSLNGSSLLLSSCTVALVPACIAGAAYYLLLALNLATPMAPRVRLKSLLFLFLSFLALNILRILLFISLFNIGFQYFDIAHKAAWYFGSTILVVLIWFANVRLLDIRAIPAFTDMRTLYDLAKGRKK